MNWEVLYKNERMIAYELWPCEEIGFRKIRDLTSGVEKLYQINNFSSEYNEPEYILTLEPKDLENQGNSYSNELDLICLMRLVEKKAYLESAIHNIANSIRDLRTQLANDKTIKHEEV